MWAWSVSGAILGLADVDALMISMAHTAATGGDAAAPATAVAVGILSNTLFKLALATTLSRRPFRRTRGAGPGGDGRRVAGRAPGLPPDGP